MNKTALITGATSGIGKAYSLLLAKEGWNLILTGRREDIIRAHGKELQATFNIEVFVVIVDFNNSESYNFFLKEYIQNDRYEIGCLINNVGFSNRNNFFDTDFEKNHFMIEAHISKLSEITHYVVPGMKKRDKGIIINVSSLVGFLPSLHDPFYSGTKSFINNYSESIAMILKPHNIVVQSLCPGFTKTDFHKDMNLNKDVLKSRGLKRWMEPGDVVKYSYKKLKIGRVIVIPGVANRIVYNAVKLLPKSLYYKLASRKKILDQKN